MSEKDNSPEIQLSPADGDGSQEFVFDGQTGRISAGFDEFHQPNTKVEFLDEDGEEVVNMVEVDLSFSAGDTMARACVKQGLKKLEEARKI